MDHTAADLLRRIDRYRASLESPVTLNGTLHVRINHLHDSATVTMLKRRGFWGRVARMPRVVQHCWRFGRALPMWQRVRFCAFNVKMLFRKP